MFTRDEQRQRAPARPPQRQPGPSMSAIWPVDGAAGGTWIACNQAGLSLAVLNYNPERADHWHGGPGERSRGEIIPMAITQTSVGDAMQAAQQLDCSAYRPFHLLMIDQTQVASMVWDGHQQVHSHGTPGHLASSGLGDAVVISPRAARFTNLVADQPGPAQQDRFHADQHGDQTETWVRMQREDARSVSQTTISVDDSRIHLRYQAIDDHTALLAPHDCELSRVRPSAETGT